jgi:hypothetical protein
VYDFRNYQYSLTSQYMFLSRCVPCLLKLKLKLIYDRRSVGQAVLVSGSHLEPMTRFFFLSDDFLMCGTFSDERMGL